MAPLAPCHNGGPIFLHAGFLHICLQQQCVSACFQTASALLLDWNLHPADDAKDCASELAVVVAAAPAKQPNAGHFQAFAEAAKKLQSTAGVVKLLQAERFNT